MTSNTSVFLYLQVNQQRRKLLDLQNLIDNLDNSQETVSDKAFEDRLKEAEQRIMDLLEEAQASKGTIFQNCALCWYSERIKMISSFVLLAK